MKSILFITSFIFLSSTFCFAIVDHERDFVIYSLGKADSALRIGEYELAETLLLEVIKTSEKINYPAGKARSLRSLGWCAELQFKYDRAYQYYLQSLAIWEAIPDSNQVAKLCRDLSIIKEAQGDYFAQEKFARRAFDIVKKLRDTLQMGDMAIDLANAYKNQANFDLAKKYYDKALSCFLNYKSAASKAIAFYNLGELNYQIFELDSALHFSHQAVRFFEKTKDSVKLAQNYNLLGAIYATRLNYTEAITMYKKSAELAEAKKKSRLAFDAYLNLAEAKIYTNQLKEAKQYFLLAENRLGSNESREDNTALDKIAFSLKKSQMSRSLLQLTLTAALLVILLILFISRFYSTKQKLKLRQKNHEFILKQKQLLHEKEVLSLFRQIDQKATQSKELAEKSERKKLKDLVHNKIGSQLAATRWNVESCIEALDKNELETKDLENIWKMIDKGYKNSRNIETLILKDQSNWLQEIMVFFDLLSKKKNSKPEIHFYNHGPIEEIPSQKGEQIQEIVQIATANTLLHADADHLTCQINKVEQELIIIIEDDGKGFDLNGKFDGEGIYNLQHLVNELEGQVQIDTAPEKGTTISITIPLN